MDKKLLLLYQFDESELRFTLFETDELKHTRMLHTVSHLGPEADIYGDEYEAEEDELPPGLREAMASDLDAFMMEKYLRSLGIFGDTEQDEEAFDNLHKSEAEVRKARDRWVWLSPLLSVLLLTWNASSMRMMPPGSARCRWYVVTGEPEL